MPLDHCHALPAQKHAVASQFAIEMAAAPARLQRREAGAAKPLRPEGHERGMGGTGMIGDVDRHFIEMMIPHHQSAIEMADLALQKAQRPELKSLAADIKRTQTDEINRMRAWYRQWYGLEVPEWPARGGMSGMGMNGMGMMGQSSQGMNMGDDPALLEKAMDFDKAFITLMIPHHKMALMMSNMVLTRGEHEELREMARAIINSQSAEIERMQGWYIAWYGQGR